MLDTVPDRGARADVDPRSLVPGAFEEELDRQLDGGGLIEFAEAPAGWLTRDGLPRLTDYRAYHFTPPATTCERCSGGGRLFDKSARGRKCPPCDGTGNPSRRTRYRSVTTILGEICPKDGLAPWYEQRGIEGVIAAIRAGQLDPFDESIDVVEWIRRRGLGGDGARDEATTRGLNVHDMLETYMKTGRAPNLAEHPEPHRPFVRGLVGWLLEADPEPVLVEELVCSPADGYAGRMDLLCRIRGELVAVDLKTQKDCKIFESAHLQLAAYMRGHVVCGGDPPDRGIVVAVAADGAHREMPLLATQDDLDRALGYADALRPLSSRCDAANARETAARKAVAA